MPSIVTSTSAASPYGADGARERGADDRGRTPEPGLVHAVRGHQPPCHRVGLAELGKRLASGHRDPDGGPTPRHQLPRRAEGAVCDHVDASVGEDEPVAGLDRIEGNPAGNSRREGAVEEVRLVGRDEHRGELRRQGAERPGPVIGRSGEVVQHGPLEPERHREPRERGLRVAVGEIGLAGRSDGFGLGRKRLADVGRDGPRDVARREEPADQVRDRPDHAEALEPDVVRDAGGDRGTGRRAPRLEVVGIAVADDDPEAVPREVAEREPPVGLSKGLEAHVREREGPDGVGLDAIERDELGRHGAPILRARERDPPVADAEPIGDGADGL